MTYPGVNNSPTAEYAGFWRRFGAALIDGIILGIVGFVLGFVLGLVAGGTVAPTVSNGIGVVLSWLYYAGMESSNSQATVGKMALGIVVTDMQGQRISFGKATLRWVGKIVSGLILLIGYIMAAFTERKQGLHDLIAGTLVITRR